MYSWSKYNTYRTSPYEYFLKYILRIREDRADSAYAPYGSTSHDILEKFYKKEIEYQDMITEFDDALFTFDLSGLKFDRNNEEKNRNIAKKYAEGMRHFFKYHKAIEGKVDLERFLTIKVGDYLFQGYADMVRKDVNDNFIIQDWKTSSIYKGKKIEKESGQLVLYAEALHQLGVPINKIRICWNFLKYCSISVEQANGKTVVRNIGRHEIAEALKSNAKMWLKKLGYEADLENYLEQMELCNSIECLPEDVQVKYVIDDCYVFIPLSEETIMELKDKIIATINEIKEKEEQYNLTKDDKIFWDNNVAEESFYFATLCGYSARLHKPYGAYLDTIEANKESSNNLFSGLGDSTDTEDDLSWLNQI